MWETVSLDTQVPLLSSVIVQIVSSIGMVLIESGGSVFWKVFFVQIGASLCGLLPPVLFYRMTFLHPSSAKEQYPNTSIVQIFTGLKGRSLVRFCFASGAMFLSSVNLFYSLGTSTVANVTVFSLVKLFVEVAANSVKATKVGRVIFVAGTWAAILIISVTSKMNIACIFVSAGSLWLSTLYLKLLVPSVHGEVFALCAVSGGAAVLGGLVAIAYERFRMDLCLLRAVTGGILAFSPLSYLVLLKKSTATPGAALAYCGIPPIVGFVLNSIGKKSETPLSVLFGVVLAFIGCHLLCFQPAETIILKPFSTRRSTMHFCLSMIVVLGVICQYILASKSGQIWRMADSLYLLLCLRWTAAEVIRTIQKASTLQFSYGHGRIGQIFQFSLGVIAIFNSVFVMANCFSEFAEIVPVRTWMSLLVVIVHLLLLVFFVWFPRGRTRSRASIINAVNFSASSDTAPTSKHPNYDPCDIAALVLSVIGIPIKVVLLDRALTIVFLAAVMYLAIPMIKESIYLLLQSTSDLMVQNISQIKSELKLCHCVLGIKKFNVWQNDEDLSVATILVQVDERVLTKPQDFLMYVISLCQQVGILDVTVELINRDSLTVSYGMSNSGYFRNTPSPI